MTRYWRDGFWRTSASGNDHWVEGHWVGRNNWDRSNGGNGGSGRATSSNFINVAAREATFLDGREAKTRSTICWWCGDSVFYHTNGNGDSVLFDSLGWPWEVHPCWTEYSNGKKTNSDISFASDLGQHLPKPSLYFDQFTDPNIERTATATLDNKYSLIVGAALSLNSVRVSKYSVFGFSEVELSEHMNLSIADLEESYGEFYRKCQDGDVLIKKSSFTATYEDIETKSIDEKYKLIVSAIVGTFHAERGKFGFYISSIDLFAKIMGLSVSGFRLHFGQVCTEYRSGKVYVPNRASSVHPFKKKKVNKNIMSFIKIEASQKTTRPIKANPTRKTDISIGGLTMRTSGSSTGLIRKVSNLPTELARCPRCNNYASNNSYKLNQHIKRCRFKE